jgi:hypothetical protein
MLDWKLDISQHVTPPDLFDGHLIRQAGEA